MKEVNNIFKLDYSIDSPQQRVEIVKQYCAETPSEELDSRTLEAFSNYIILAAEKEERRLGKIKALSANKQVTINKRETSLEGLAASFECGADAVYALITNDKNVIFSPKKEITTKDLAEIPELVQLRKAISAWERRLINASGRAAYVIKQTIIDLKKDQYVIKDFMRRPISLQGCGFTSSQNRPNLDSEEIYDAETDSFTTIGVSLCNPKVCAAVLANYSRLKQDSWGVFDSDTFYFMEDFDRIADTALASRPLYERIVELKVDGLQNNEIQEILEAETGTKYTPQWISSVWTTQAPRLIALAAQDEYLAWHFREKSKGKYKTCSRCKQIKLAMPRYFNKNPSASDGLYSQCKECRRKKRLVNPS